MRVVSDRVEWRTSAAAIPPGGAVTFTLRCGGRAVAGFLIHWRGGYHAYANRCPHRGTPLDLWPGEFFTADGTALICATHGAVFDPATGRCTSGPCAGDALTPLPLRREGADLVVGCPTP